MSHHYQSYHPSVSDTRFRYGSGAVGHRSGTEFGYGSGTELGYGSGTDVGYEGTESVGMGVLRAGMG
eukprot:1003419-Rhodomonas_salina.1